MVSKSNKLDLSYIYEISDGDREFIKEMLETFLRITPEAFEDMVASGKSGNWKEVGRLAHKIKPTIMLLDDDVLSKMIKNLEHEAKQEINLEGLLDKIQETKAFCDQIVSEIGSLIQTDSY